MTDDPERTRPHLAAVLKAFGPIEAIVDYVGPDWGAVSEPDLFDRPTRANEVARHVEHKIREAGLLYWRATKFPSVAETRDLLDDLEVKLGTVYRLIQRLPNARNAFNVAWDEGVLDEDNEDYVPPRDTWEHLHLVIDDGRARVAFLLRSDVDLGELLEQPPTNQKNPERVLWETIFALLRECGVEPLEKYQPLIHTLRAAHLLFGIDEPPNAGSVGYVKSEFLKQEASSGTSKALD
ncbi:hypothetical protein [Bradyrhizobium diazoefficiens]|uniref:hypothetical protein n=1 Tax=Bradyrhizobium diazoefficiens TaxID=1355477 RepID=UPI002714B52C|nr:hypothetical protein [Bradyrhizobium diazoefficiens]WLB40259.1 hypothetical protein QIH78_10855 [Bradyrhizobium diazoefficiens]WLC14767.1 hypothetical protein QIH76_32195 [Bradyrhizobium diazoefficiens]